MFEEVDYIKEGNNAERFAELYGLRPPSSMFLLSFSRIVRLVRAC
jgi:hypothetical protein